MVTILDKIISEKKKEVDLLKSRVSTKFLEQEKYFLRPKISMKESLQEKSATGIIAEFKRASPSRGTINDEALVEDVVQGYAKFGASGISVLTDKRFFSGHLDDLKKARAVAEGIPILRKDFIIDEYQILEAKAFGADVILLIAACLNRDEVIKLSNFARQVDLEVLLEVHNETELEHICPQIDIVGVNNRDLKTFTVDVNRSLELSDKIPVEKVKISESGIDNIAIIKRLKDSGFVGFLMGEIFMKETNPVSAFENFITGLQQSSLMSKTHRL